MSRSSRIKRCMAIATVFAAACAVPAQAKIYEHERFAGTESEEFEECGMQLRSDVEFSATSITRVGKGKLDTAFFGHFMVDYVETLTNLANGKFFTTEGNVLNKDVKAVPVEGSIFKFVSTEVGRRFTLRDMSGETVIRERGQLRFTYLFDTEGDDVPGGIPIGDDLDVKVAGPHAAFEMTDEEWCGLMNDLIG